MEINIPNLIKEVKDGKHLIGEIKSRYSNFRGIYIKYRGTNLSYMVYGSSWIGPRDLFLTSGDPSEYRPSESDRIQAKRSDIGELYTISFERMNREEKENTLKRKSLLLEFIKDAPDTIETIIANLGNIVCFKKGEKNAFSASHRYPNRFSGTSESLYGIKTEKFGDVFFNPSGEMKFAKGFTDPSQYDMWGSEVTIAIPKDKFSIISDFIKNEFEKFFLEFKVSETGDLSIKKEFGIDLEFVSFNEYKKIVSSPEFCAEVNRSIDTYLGHSSISLQSLKVFSVKLENYNSKSEVRFERKYFTKKISLESCKENWEVFWTKLKKAKYPIDLNRKKDPKIEDLSTPNPPSTAKQTESALFPFPQTLNVHISGDLTIKKK